MDEILPDLHLDTKIEICILMKVVVQKLKYAEQAWDRNMKFVEQLGTLQTTAKNITRRSKTTGNTVLRAQKEHKDTLNTCYATVI